MAGLWAWDINNPSNVLGWVGQRTQKAVVSGEMAVSPAMTQTCSWSRGNPFTSPGDPWNGGEAIVRLQAGPTCTGNPTDFRAPVNWQSLDNGDTDLGGCSPTLIDVPGANPSQMVPALGKDRNAY